VIRARGPPAAGTPPTRWTYLDKANHPPARSGIDKVTITDKSKSVPGLIGVVVNGVERSYALAPGQEPLTVTVELNATALPNGATPGVDQCADATFFQSPRIPTCRFAGGGSKLAYR